MGLESASFINGLVATNPVGGDPRSEGDDHIRLLKAVLLATFPNITGAVTLTQAQINSLTDASGLNYAGGTNLAASSVETAIDTLDTAKAGLALRNVFTKGNAGAIVALTDAATVAVDLSLSNNFSLLMTSGIGATRALGTPTNVVAGQSGTIAITQDGVGSRALTFGANYKFVGGTAPTLSTAANAVDYLTYYVETTSRILISILKDIR